MNHQKKNNKIVITNNYSESTDDFDNIDNNEKTHDIIIDKVVNKQNIGPYGNSNFTDKNPLVIKITHDFDINNIIIGGKNKKNKKYTYKTPLKHKKNKKRKTQKK